MTRFQKQFLAIIKCAITGETPIISEDFDWAAAYKLCYKHQIICLFFIGASNSDKFKTNKIYDVFLKAYYNVVMINERQNYEIGLLFNKFRENNISFLPLKGVILKKIYPTSEMRTMSDVDILIKIEEYDKIKEIMKTLRFTEGVESDHELHWVSSSGFMVELHKKVIPSYNVDFFEYFNSGWDRAEKIGNSSEYRYSDEDFFIYIFTHFAKHYRDSGVGIKYVVDFYIFLKKYKELNFGYIDEVLKKLNLFVFYENILKLIDVWFEDNVVDNKTSFLTDKIFSSGVYGTKDNNNLSSGLKQSKTEKHFRLRNLFFMIFLPYKAMKVKYKILSRVPVLLPIMWVYRWFEVLFKKPSRIKSFIDEEKQKNPENLKAYQEKLNYVGLDYNFPEKNNQQDNKIK